MGKGHTQGNTVKKTSLSTVNCQLSDVADGVAGNKCKCDGGGAAKWLSALIYLEGILDSRSHFCDNLGFL